MRDGLDELAIGSEGGQADKTVNFPSSMAFYIGYQQKVWFKFREDLPNSNDSIKKIPQRCAHYLDFS